MNIYKPRLRWPWQWTWKVHRGRLIVAAHLNGSEPGYLYWSRVLPWWLTHG